MVLNKYKDHIPPSAVYIGRPTKWGNPFVIGKDGTRQEVVDKFEKYLVNSPLFQDIKELQGKDLVCFCSPHKCHGDILNKYANQEVNE